MTTGTPQFVGDRLREAREARGLSAATLAELVGVTRQAVSQYETGGGTPRPEVMQRICAVLNLPAHFFWRRAEPAETSTIFYRSLSAATKTARTRAERRFQWLREVVAYLHEFVEFPAVNVPHLASGQDPLDLSAEEVDEWAERTRRFWSLGDGPISNIVWLLENNGIIVARAALDAESLDALSIWAPGAPAPYIFLGTDKDSAPRSRLDAAHELGHLVLHRYVEKARFSHAAQHKMFEEQAFRFGSAFLLPGAAFARDFYLPTLEAFRGLKDKWRVSIAAMMKRSAELDLVSEDHMRRLWMSYVRRGWRTGEPLDDLLQAEQPKVLRRSFELILNEGIQSRAQIRARLPFAPSDIETLAGLPPGYLQDLPPTVRVLDTVAEYHTETSRRRSPADSGTVVYLQRERPVP